MFLTFLQRIVIAASSLVFLIVLYTLHVRGSFFLMKLLLFIKKKMTFPLRFLLNFKLLIKKKKDDISAISINFCQSTPMGGMMELLKV